MAKMKRQTLLQHESTSCRLNYRTKIGPQSRTGFVYSVGGRNIIFWPFEEDKELVIAIDDIDSAWPVKGEDKD